MNLFEKFLTKITTLVWRYERFIRRIQRENKVNYWRLFKRLKERKNGGR